MAQASSFRSGMVLQLDDALWQISEAQLVRPGKGGAFVRTKLKNLETGTVVERTFRSEEKVKDVRIDRKPMQYLYQDADQFFFMDQSTYEQVLVERDFIGDVLDYLKEGNEVDILFHGTRAVGIELPNFVELKIDVTEPGLKGDSVSGATKPATLETGAIIQVPLFIEPGDIVRIDTRTDAYVERI